MLPSVTFMCITAINILRCFGYPREHNFGLILILSPTGCAEGCVYFPQSCNTHLPHFLDCLLNTTLIPCLLFFFLSILHERLRLIQQSTKLGNRYTAHGRYEYSYNLAHSRENWAPPPKKIATRCCLVPSACCLIHVSLENMLHLIGVSRLTCRVR